MKKLILLGVGSALAFTMGGVGPAQADNSVTHTSSAKGASTPGVIIASAGAGKCASCHRAHTAKATYLLKQAQPELCYSCHSSGLGSSLDVAAGSENGTGLALRGGGFETAQISSGAATKDMGTVVSGKLQTLNQMIPALAESAKEATTSKHQIDGTAGQTWGNGALNTGVGKSMTLECGSCHDPHGNGNYRILRPIPVDSGAGAPRIIRPATAAKDATATAAAIPPVAAVWSVDKAGVKIPDAGAKVYTTINYWLAGDTNVPVDATALYTGELTDASAGVGGVAPDGYIANVANWCTTCHSRYLATNKSYETPSGDAQFMYRHRSDANYKAGAANCITCHVSHGSNATMGGDAATEVLLPGDVAGSASVDSKLLRVDNRGTCVMCHNV